MAITLNGAGSITGLTSGAGIAAAALSGQVPDANAPSGSVIQTVSGYNNAKVYRNTSGYIWENAATLTPSSTSSKILILANLAFGQSNLNGGVRIYRNGAGFMPNLASEPFSGGATNAFNDADDGFFSGAYQIGNYLVKYLDNPNTTSACAYSLYFYTASGGDVNFNRQRLGNDGNAMSTFTLLEIAG